MMLFDTNILSELMRAEPHLPVLEWVDSLPPKEVATRNINDFTATGIAVINPWNL